jgi:RNA polymerase sigma factor for flagellar operon FliA
MDAAVHTYQKIARRHERDGLIEQHVKLVKHLLGRMLRGLPDHVDRENLESAGMLGLVEAAHQFDPARGTTFASFATTRIRGAIIDELRRNCPLPQSMQRQWRTVREAYARLTDAPTPEALAAESGLTVEEVEACLEAVRLTRSETWHDDLGEQLTTKSDDAIERQLEYEEKVRIVADLIERLPTQMRIVVTLYYRDGLRLKEIGEVLKLSESRISRILTRAELLMRERVDRQMERGAST